MEEEENNQKSGQTSYQKRPLWQWILIYAVVGIVIYGLVYYFVFYKKGKTNSSPYSKATQNQYQSQPTEVPVITKAVGEEAEKVTISLTKDGFTPQTVMVKAGTKVVWTNESGKAATVNSAVHPTHQVYPPLNLGQFADGESLSLVFDTPGTYKYHNHLNTSEFGTVIVE